jgi:hypothetical protein
MTDSWSVPCLSGQNGYRCHRVVPLKFYEIFLEKPQLLEQNNGRIPLFTCLSPPFCRILSAILFSLPVPVSRKLQNRRRRAYRLVTVPHIPGPATFLCFRRQTVFAVCFLLPGSSSALSLSPPGSLAATSPSMLLLFHIFLKLDSL